ncbi:MAG TPA: hypothetical protein VFF13_01910 [archaeon]|nr:hypothetical protein [archaeon]
MLKPVRKRGKKPVHLKDQWEIYEYAMGRIPGLAAYFVKHPEAKKLGITVDVIEEGLRERLNREIEKLGEEFPNGATKTDIIKRTALMWQNNFINFVRSTKRTQPHIDAFKLDSARKPPATAPDSQLITHEFLKTLNRAIEKRVSPKLVPFAHAYFDLRLIDPINVQKELSSQFKVPIGTVKSRISRIKAALSKDRALLGLRY